MNIYVDLTKQFNKGKLRAIISSGQAVVLHRLAIMSKDGDWIIREDEESINHILNILNNYGARYRFGAPFDIRWMRGGWSSHFEFSHNDMRIRTDFLTRPPRISTSNLERLWEEHQFSDIPFVNIIDLVKLKMTNREKDYAVIGELVRLMSEPRAQLLYSRSARDILNLAEKHTNIIAELITQRPLLAKVSEGREKLEETLDAEKRSLIHENEKRLEFYFKAAEKWTNLWPSIENEIKNDSLLISHQKIVQQATCVLPYAPQEINNV